MPQISLTDFVDIVSKAGIPKATKIAEVKNRPEYEPAFDFYKPLREHITDTHKSSGDKKSLGNVLNKLTDLKKSKNYPPLVEGYKKWWGKKEITWFTPPRDSYVRNNFEIILNPELGLDINGERHVIKLYFKADSLSVQRIKIITDLMEHQLRSQVKKTDKFGILDVRNSKLHLASTPPTSIPLVNAELAYITSLWAE
jgi:hypothetical protein